MSPRDHYTPGQAPDWSDAAQAFRRLDGGRIDWRHPQPARKPSWRARLRARLLGLLERVFPDRVGGGEPGNWRQAGLYLGISGWVVLTVILGAMALLKGGWLS